MRENIERLELDGEENNLGGGRKPPHSSIASGSTLPLTGVAERGESHVLDLLHCLWITLGLGEVRTILEASEIQYTPSLPLDS